MSKPSSRSTLYRLIEAGQLAHQALLAPLHDRGLEPGDDAVLFVLHRKGTSEEELSAELGLEGDALNDRVQRLIDRDLVVRQAVGPLLTPGLALTERGTRIRNGLAENWAVLEDALLGELKKQQRKNFGNILKRFVDLLRL